MFGLGHQNLSFKAFDYPFTLFYKVENSCLHSKTQSIFLAKALQCLLGSSLHQWYLLGITVNRQYLANVVVHLSMFSIFLLTFIFK